MSHGDKGKPRLALRQLIWICLGTITLAFVGSTALSVLGRVDVTRTVGQLNEHILPAQQQVDALSKAYVDQETGLRGFMLAGHRAFLEPYTQGRAEADRRVAELHTSLAGDPEALRQLDAVVAVARDWVTQDAEPQITTRLAGPIPSAQFDAMTLSGKRRFDQLRARLSALEVRTHELITQQIHRIHSTQRLANIAQGTAALLLLAVVVISVGLLHRLVTQPVNRVLRDITAVAEGDYDRAIRSAGLREIAVLAGAAETMRDNLRTSTTRLLEAERRDEQTRMAADLHDRTIRRVYALGLGLTSAGQRRSPDLMPFVDETDSIIADLREIVFNLSPAGADPTDDQVGLRSAIIDVVEESVPALGFTPDLEFDGPIRESIIERTAQTEIVAALRELLNNIARRTDASAATIHLTATDKQLRLSVHYNGISVTAIDPDGGAQRSIQRGAPQLGGYATIRNADDNGGTIVEWAVPLAADAERHSASGTN